MIKVSTPLGEIAVEEFGTYDEYPGVTIFINGIQIATAEYDTGNDRMQLNVWEGDYEVDPAYHIEYPDLEER